MVYEVRTMNVNTDVVLEAIEKLAKVCLPIAGVVVLVYLVLLLKELIVTLKNVNGVIQKLDAPLNTVEELSHTVDDVHHKTKEVVTKATVATKENVETIKSWAEGKITQIKNKKAEKAIDTAEEE